MRVTYLLGLSVIFSGCSGLSVSHESQGVGSRTLEPWGDMGQGAKLYARDGSPVPNEAASALITAESVPRELGQNDGSRPYLLELYQDAIDQKEKLEAESMALQEALVEADQRRLRDEAERDALNLNIESLQRDIARLEETNMELAGRLVTAQIRRLEAERLVLETTLEWSRFQRPKMDGEDSSVELEQPDLIERQP